MRCLQGGSSKGPSIASLYGRLFINWLCQEQKIIVVGAKLIVYIVKKENRFIGVPNSLERLLPLVQISTSMFLQINAPMFNMALQKLCCHQNAVRRCSSEGCSAQIGLGRICVRHAHRALTQGYGSRPAATKLAI